MGVTVEKITEHPIFKQIYPGYDKLIDMDFLKKNPIVQAMMPPKQEIITKKGAKDKVSFAPNVQNPYTNEVTSSPARSANDYEPPNAFLDTIQRPLPNQNSGVSGAGNVVADLWKFI